MSGLFSPPKGQIWLQEPGLGGQVEQILQHLGKINSFCVCPWGCETAAVPFIPLERSWKLQIAQKGAGGVLMEFRDQLKLHSGAELSELLQHKTLLE